MVSEAQKKASNKHNKENTKIISLRLNFRTDKDILEKLDNVPSKMGYIKELIRKDIASQK